MASLSIRNLSKTYGTTNIVSDFSLEIPEGELVAFLGPSGCGKTTVLRMIAGFVEPTEGTLLIGGDDVSDRPAHRRDTGMVFQKFALFPHMTVAENVAFGLEMRRRPRHEVQQRVGAALELVRMSALKDRFPRQLSGGQQQRVAIARALVVEPKLFLLDEPLSALDANLRVEIRDDIRSLQRRLGLTAIFVTHDQEEAMAIADRIVIMHEGRVQQVGTPETLYDCPVNPFVARFLGPINILSGDLRSPTEFATKAGLVLRAPTTTIRACELGVRPERISLSKTAVAENAVSGIVSDVAHLGAFWDVTFTLNDADRLNIRLSNAAGAVRPNVGEALFACFNAEDCLLFAGTPT